MEARDALLTQRAGYLTSGPACPDWRACAIITSVEDRNCLGSSALADAYRRAGGETARRSESL